MVEAKRDPRVDRFITWALSAIVAAALLWSVDTFSNLETTIDNLRGDVSGLSTEVQVLGERMGRIGKLEQRLEDHIGRDVQGKLVQQVGDLDRRVTNLEK